MWVDDLAEFRALEPEWAELASREPSPFLTHTWMTCWWKAFGQGTPRVCTVRRDGRLVAALPLWSRRGALQGWSNVETDDFLPLAETDDDLRALVDAVGAASWSRLTLRGLPEGHRATELLLARAASWSSVHTDRFDEAPVIETTGTFAEYHAGLSKNTRQRIGKHRRRLERDHEVEIATLVNPPDPVASLDEYLDLEAAGWKGLAGTAVRSTPARVDFYRDVVRAFAATDALRVSELRVDGRLASFDLALVGGGRVASLITSYDEGLGPYSPGLILRMALVEACFEQGYAANDLLGALLDWKTKFITGTRPTLTVRLYRRRPAPLVRYAVRTHAIPHARPLNTKAREAKRRLTSLVRRTARRPPPSA